LNALAATGRFDNHPGEDMLLWHDNYLDIGSSGTGATRRQSRQDMR
jgi:hypothetical protein